MEWVGWSGRVEVDEVTLGGLARRVEWEGGVSGVALDWGVVGHRMVGLNSTGRIAWAGAGCLRDEIAEGVGDTRRACLIEDRVGGYESLILVEQLAR